ncbi:MAG TPA: polyketide synthase, partial [Isosphaeraceae bacterium]|nr:polyketide synthase [Isosphaeraceae bacterium]
MRLSIPRVMAFSPNGLAEPSIVVAAVRAGALGVLDFELGFRAQRVLDAACDVARFVSGPFGLRLPAEALTGFNIADLPPNLSVLIAAEPAEGGWSDWLPKAMESGRAVFAEVTSRTSANEALKAGAEALVIAGHEAGGRVGEESSFVLLQGVLSDCVRQVWVRGGIGPKAASACVAAGATGVVLDGPLWLARESPLPAPVRERLEHWDGTETLVYGKPAGLPYRLHAAPGSALATRLRIAEAAGRDAWNDAVREAIGWETHQAWPAGQDASLAARLARRHGTVGGIIQAVEQAIASGPSLARAAGGLSEASPLALAHGTRFPIVQGPMTRVSDTAAFAEAVACGGGLPFLALALMRGPDVRALLAEAKRRLEGKSWGVGILGFVPPELRLEQVKAIQEAHPPFALIAGGRPDQARDLERQGIPTYLHVPSPGLLRQYLKEGSRRFVLEGRECGGHVGPRSSFVLWEQAVDVVADAIEQGTCGS